MLIPCGALDQKVHQIELYILVELMVVMFEYRGLDEYSIFSLMMLLAIIPILCKSLQDFPKHLQEITLQTGSIAESFSIELLEIVIVQIMEYGSFHRQDINILVIR
jgi:hypothetical protein